MTSRRTLAAMKKRVDRTPVGWQREPARHGLASKGVKTTGNGGVYDVMKNRRTAALKIAEVAVSSARSHAISVDREHHATLYKQGESKNVKKAIDILESVEKSLRTKRDVIRKSQGLGPARR